MKKLRAEFYHHDGQPFLVQGKHATKSDLEELPDYLYIPMMTTKPGQGTLGDFTLLKFARLAVSTDGVVGLYWLCKIREWEAQGSA